MGFFTFLEDLRLRKDLSFLASNDPNFIKNKVRFLNTGSKQELGLIVMEVTPEKKYDKALIIFNNSKTKITYPLASQDWKIHPVINSGSSISRDS